MSPNKPEKAPRAGSVLPSLYWASNRDSIGEFQYRASHVKTTTGTDGVTGRGASTVRTELQLQWAHSIMAATLAGTGFRLSPLWKTHFTNL